MAFAFDTLVQAKRLQEAGFNEKQAEALTGVLRDAVKPFDTSELATKADIAVLSATQADLASKADLAALKDDVTALKADLAALSAATKADLAATNANVAALKSDLSARIAETKADLGAKIAETKAELLQWIVGLIAGAVVVNAFVVVGSILGLLKLLGH